MGYKSWFDAHAKKHEALVATLKAQGIGDEALVAYFVFENMCKHAPDFCPLYASGKKCHDKGYLNCFLCACPHFRFQDTGLHVKEDGTVMKSTCAIRSRFAKKFVHGGVEHLDCSDCVLPHTKAFVRSCVDKPWRETMGACLVVQGEYPKDNNGED